ncbi:PQQ-binding-like beta-propeller repeat protein [Streptomyces sp. NPDC059639]|uniref:protein kinase domain-containing protein n=1 Tax=Streptomyces sp. NPDC059639 TaxID=3346891 RepID=UPI0036AA5D7C
MPLSREDPQAIGDYTLVDRIGSGGMGVVYTATSPTGRRVALKVVHQQFADDEEFRGRFRQEVAAARRVSGAFTAAVVDADPDAVRPWMATAFIEGPTLADRVRSQGALYGRELRDLAVGLVEALRDIHRAGLVHRDLKPANIVLSQDGPRVIDFGISRAADNQTLTMTGRVLGTPPFMSPEQVRSPRAAGPASDVFSLAAVLVFAATGRGPFDGDSPYLTAYQVVHEQPDLTGVPGALRAAVEPCLAKEETDRASLDSLLTELLRLPTTGSAPLLPASGSAAAADTTRTSDNPSPAAAPAPPTEAFPTAMSTTTSGTASPARRRRTLLGLVGGALGLAVVVGGGAVLLHAPEAASGSSGAGPSASASSAALPAGWHAWQTVLGTTRGGAHADAQGCAVHGQELYCVDGKHAVARVDAADGSVAWRTGIPQDVIRPLGVTDRTVVTLEKTPAGGFVVVGRALDDGGIVWQQGMASDRRFAAMSDGTVFAVRPDDGRIVALRATDGQEMWRADRPGGCDLDAYEGTLYGTCETGDGPHKVLRFRPDDGAVRQLASTPDRIRPIGVADGDIVALGTGEADGSGRADPGAYTRLVRIDTTTGSPTTTPITGLGPSADATPHLVGGIVYFLRNTGKVDAVDALTGRHLWSRTGGAESLGVAAAPVLNARRDEAYFLSAADRLTAVEPRTGLVKWRGPDRPAPKAAGGMRSAPSLTLVDDALIVAAHGRLLSVSPTAPSAKPHTNSL